jgi:hypothetical protein
MTSGWLQLVAVLGVFSCIDRGMDDSLRAVLLGLRLKGVGGWAVCTSHIPAGGHGVLGFRVGWGLWHGLGGNSVKFCFVFKGRVGS